MTTTTNIRVNTAISSIGKQQKNDGWMLVLDYQLPESSYGLSLYGKDWEQVKGHGIGDAVCATIQQGRLKDGKDPAKSYNYFYNLVSLEAPDPNLVIAPAPTRMQDPEINHYREEPPAATGADSSPFDAGGGGYARPGFPIVAGEIQGHLEKMATDIAITKYGLILADGDITVEQLIWETRYIRDSLFHLLKQQPIAPLHFCYLHAAIFREGKEDWGHKMDDGGWCLGQGGIMPPQEPSEVPLAPLPDGTMAVALSSDPAPKAKGKPAPAPQSVEAFRAAHAGEPEPGMSPEPEPEATGRGD